MNIELITVFTKKTILPKCTSGKRNVGQIKLIYICLQIALNLSMPMKNVILSTITQVTNPLRGEEVVSVKQCSGSKVLMARVLDDY